MAAPDEKEDASPDAVGRAEAEAIDGRLRELETREREERLARSGVVAAGRRAEYQASVDVERLKARIEELSSFRRAVLDSTVWRTAQALRRLLGRAW